MTFENRHALRRFACKLVILVICSVAQWQAGILLTLTMLFGMASVIDIVFALITKAPLWHAHLTYWDEAAVFLILFLIAVAILNQ